MTYIDPVKWLEAQEIIRQKLATQPRGYQSELAVKLGKSRAFVNQLATGARPIPIELMDAILETLGLTYDVVLTELTTQPNADASAPDRVES